MQSGTLRSRQLTVTRLAIDHSRALCRGDYYKAEDLAHQIVAAAGPVKSLNMAIRHSPLPCFCPPQHFFYWILGSASTVFNLPISSLGMSTMGLMLSHRSNGHVLAMETKILRHSLGLGEKGTSMSQLSNDWTPRQVAL